jgi:hypothetical protein
MTVRSSEDVSDTIGLIYDAVTSENSWQPALAKMRDLFDGSRACVTLWASSDLVSQSTAGDGAPPNALEMFQEIAAIGWNEVFDRVPIGGIYQDQHVVDLPIFRKTMTWNDWCRPRDMYGGLGVKMVTGFFDVQRGRKQNAFDKDEVSLLRQFSPHFARAEEISHRLAVADAFKAAGALHEVAAVIVDGQLQIAGQNEAAEALLAENRLISARGGTLQINPARENNRLKKLVADACQMVNGVLAGTGGDLMVSGPGGLDAGGLIVSVSPTRVPGSLRLASDPRALVAIRRIEPGVAYNSELFLRSSFDLTPSSRSAKRLLISVCASARCAPILSRFSARPARGVRRSSWRS